MKSVMGCFFSGWTQPSFVIAKHIFLLIFHDFQEISVIFINFRRFSTISNDFQQFSTFFSSFQQFSKISDNFQFLSILFVFRTVEKKLKSVERIFQQKCPVETYFNRFENITQSFHRSHKMLFISFRFVPFRSWCWFVINRILKNVESES